MKKSKIINNSLFGGFFFVFSGYFVMLLLVTNLLSNEYSRYFTIPVRLLILSFFYILFKSANQKLSSKAFIFFLLFALMYLFRIFIEKFRNNIYYLPVETFLFYFLAFVLIPFVLVARTFFTKENYKIIFRSIIVGSVLIAVFTYFFYGNLIGEVDRITQEVGKEDNYISPLALSYCSVLGISVCVSYILTNKLSSKNLMLFFLIILICLIPFFLGASRGSILAVLLPFVLYIFFSKSIQSKLRFIVISFLFAITVYFATNFLGTGVFDRMFNISEAIESGSSSAIRLLIWEADLNYFIKHPIMGNTLQSSFVAHHPHNIIIESLITTGLLGSIPFLIFLILIFIKIIKIIRCSPQYFWLTNMFLIGFAQHMFSGSIWGMSWVAVGAALIVGFNIKSINYIHGIKK